MAEVPEHLFDGAAAVLLHREQAAEHAKGLLGEAPPLRRHRVRPPPLPTDELLVERVRGQSLLPREVTGQHAEQQHTEGPDVSAVVHAEALVAGHIAELRSCVGDGAAHLEGKPNRLQSLEETSEYKTYKTQTLLTLFTGEPARRVMPKSDSLTLRHSRSKMRMFSGLMSRWTSFLQCR